MFLAGTFVNTLAILVGSGIGFLLPNIPERVKSTVMQGLSLTIILIGLGMALSDQRDVLVIILSMVIGALIGEWANIEHRLDQLGKFAARRTRAKAPQGSETHVSDAFVTASLVFCVGSMAILGAIQSGFGSNTTLYAKSMLDFVTATVFASTMGIGVALSAAPVLIYEGLIATIAYLAGNAINAPAVIACVTAVGGLLITAIGLNLLGIRKIAVGNLLPSMFVAAGLKVLAEPLGHVVAHLLR